MKKEEEENEDENEEKEEEEKERESGRAKARVSQAMPSVPHKHVYLKYPNLKAVAKEL